MFRVSRVLLCVRHGSSRAEKFTCVGPCTKGAALRDATDALPRQLRRCSVAPATPPLSTNVHPVPANLHKVHTPLTPPQVRPGSFCSPIIQCFLNSSLGSTYAMTRRGIFVWS